MDTLKRELVKSKGQGTLSDAVQNFLVVNRSTPNETVLEQKLPAEILMGRRLKMIHSQIHPSNASTPVKIKSEKQAMYEVGCFLFAGDYSATHGS